MFTRLLFCYCGPKGARTLDPLIKSQLLYQLSYRTGRAKLVQVTIPIQILLSCKKHSHFSLIISSE
jgi:hypothetical protein